MADHEEKKHEESLIEKIAEKIHDHDSSSSSDSDDEKSSPSSVKSKIYRLFGGEKPLHQVLRGVILAIIFLLKIQSTGGRQLYVADKVDPQNGPPAPRAQYPNHH